MRKIPLSSLLPLAAAWSLVACADPPAAENPPQPTATAEASATATAEATASAAPVTTSAPTASAKVEAPPAKPLKEKVVGKWQFSFEGEPKTKAEEELKKKFAKEKDTKKLDAELAKLSEAAAGEWIEFEGGNYVSHVTEKGKDKVVLKVKYEVTKEEGSKLTMKPSGKDEISKKELKDEVTLTFIDDNTISMFDPGKKLNLTFKRK